METDAVILVTGARGMVGSGLVRLLRAEGYSHVLAPGRGEVELADRTSVDGYFGLHRPEFVFMIAAKVGGIGANLADPVGFLSDNLKVEVNLFEACHRFGTKKNLFLGSSCIYPRESPQPMKEEYLMTGPLEPTNEGVCSLEDCWDSSGPILPSATWHADGLPYAIQHLRHQ